MDSSWNGALIGGGVAFGIWAALLAQSNSSNPVGLGMAGMLLVPSGIGIGAAIDSLVTRPVYTRRSQSPGIAISPWLGRHQKGIVAQVHF